jgi:hypothetical protein
MALVEPKFRAATGRQIGAMTWLAEGIGVQKQALANCKVRGRMPTKYLRKISAFTGIPMAEFQPILTEEVLAASREMRLSVKETESALICIGLDNLNMR